MENVTTDPVASSTLDVTVGITYVLTAVIFIFLQILCSYLIYTDKDMRNPTYFLMINLNIVDIVELAMIGIYSGLVILLKWHNDTAARVASFLTLTAWYANCVLFALIAFSRWVAITRPHLSKIIFRKKVLWTLQAASWLAMGFISFYGNVLYPPGPMFIYVPQHYTWTFDMTVPITPSYSYVNIIFDALCTFFEMGFNILSLYWVHKTRKQVHTVTTLQNRRREIKLLIQCVILGCVFTGCYAIFTTVSAFPQLVSLSTCLSIHGIWLFNHSINPVVYLTVNRKLRRRAVKVITCGKLVGDQVVTLHLIQVGPVKA